MRKIYLDGDEYDKETKVLFASNGSVLNLEDIEEIYTSLPKNENTFSQVLSDEDIDASASFSNNFVIWAKVGDECIPVSLESKLNIRMYSKDLFEEIRSNYIGTDEKKEIYSESLVRIVRLWKQARRITA